MSLDETRLHTLLGKMVNDMGAAAVAPLVILGDKLGLYKSLAAAGPLSTEDLAQQTGTTERYVREWCAAQAGSGYIEFDAEANRFSMTPEQQAVFADPDSPACMTGGYYPISSLFVDEPKISEAFQTGNGVPWGEHSSCLFCGTEKFFRPGYQTNLVSDWLPSLEGVVSKLEQGAKVADVGCGHGVSTLVMAAAFPQSEFIGFDFHGPSVARANVLAAESGLTNVRFEEASVKDFPGTDFDLIAFFDCLHDMGDPVGATHSTADKRSKKTGRCCWSNHSPRMNWRKTSTRSVECISASRRWSALPPPSVRRSAWRSVPRQVNASSVKWPPRRRSTWSSKRAPKAA